jgi:hypothetical protein
MGLIIGPRITAAQHRPEQRGVRRCETIRTRQDDNSREKLQNVRGDSSEIFLWIIDSASRPALWAPPAVAESVHAWRRRHTVCALNDQSSCPRTSPHRLTPSEIRVIEDIVTSPTYRHVPTGTLAVRQLRVRFC